MATVITDLSMSLDGFVAYPNDEAGALFDWYNNGDVPVQSPDGSALNVSEGSARYLRELHENVGAAVVGRRLFDFIDGWGGNSPSVARCSWSATPSLPAGPARTCPTPSSPMGCTEQSNKPRLMPATAWSR